MVATIFKFFKRLMFFDSNSVLSGAISIVLRLFACERNACKDRQDYFAFLFIRRLVRFGCFY